jgi:hypothetical protein
MEIRTLKEQERVQAGKILGHVIPRGGVGNLYTVPEMRQRGIATERLEHRGVLSSPMDGGRTSSGCVNLTAFAARRDMDLFPQRILPPDGTAFWPADRFYGDAGFE